MKRFLIFLIIYLTVSTVFIGQNSIYVGTNKYTSTDTWTFTINGYWSQGPAFVKVAKRTGGGLIMLSMASFDGTLKGNVMIYLEDGSVIQCSDKGIKDEVDYKTIGVYYLTSTEMEQMKNSDISSIRFSLYQNVMGVKNYTMNNRYETPNLIGGLLSPIGNAYKNSTAKDIREIN